MAKKLNNVLSLCGGLGLCSLFLVVVLVLCYSLTNKESFYARDSCNSKGKNWFKSPIAHTAKACKYMQKTKKGGKRVFSDSEFKNNQCCLKRK